MSPFQDHDGVNYKPSRVQSVLLKFWKQALAEVKAAAVGHDVVLHLGGDLVDGVAHHGSTQTIGDDDDQRDLAVQLLMPYVNMSKMVYALLGTDIHVGPSGQADRSVAKELGAASAYRWRLDCDGKLLDWAHHTGLGRLPWTLESVLTRLANRTIIECYQRDQRVPDVIVRHHVHKFALTYVKGVEVFTCPGWQAQTAHTRKIDPAGLLAVGVVLWKPRTNEIRHLLYEFPDDPLTKVAYAKVRH